MKKWLKYFLQGLAFLAPIYFSIYFVFRVFMASDGLFGQLLSPFGLYFPGLGLILALVLLTGTGLIVSQAISKGFVRWVDSLFARLPLIKLVYSLAKDIFASLSGERKGFSGVVRVDLGNGMAAIGLKTREVGDEVVVYLPQAYQMGGFSVLVPKSRITTLDMAVEDAMKFLLSAGLTGNPPLAGGR